MSGVREWVGGWVKGFANLGGCVGGGRYYEGGVSSVYFWDLDDGFAGVVLLKKSNVSLPALRFSLSFWDARQRGRAKRVSGL